MTGIKVSILEFTDHSNPGWVRCTFKDALGKDHFFTEKVPIITTELLDETSPYPLEGIIQCTITENEDPDPETIRIDTDHPFGICSEEEQTVFRVFKHQLIVT